MRFVVVNDHYTRKPVTCPNCAEIIKEGYTHDLKTGILYCDPECLGIHEYDTERAMEKRNARV